MYQLFVLTFCIASIGAINVQQSSQFMFRKDYEYDQLVDGWLKLHRSPATWFQARELCKKEGSILASPLYEELQKVMQELIRNKALSIFTGISSTIASGEFFPEKVMSSSPVTNGEFFSLEGVPLDDIPTRWGSEEPGKHHCIAMSANGSLTDIDCSQSRPYICFKQNTKNMTEVNECGSIDSDYVYEEKTGHCYKFHKKGKTWIDAFRTCAVEGGYLAIINSDTEAEVFNSTMKKHPESERDATDKENIAIGVLTWKSEGGDGWMTVHGERPNKAGYAGWIDGWIDDSKYEYCGAIGSSGKMTDINCRSTYSFICEMDKVDQETLTLRQMVNEISNL